LSSWQTAGLVEVGLPSGYRVRGVLPMLHTLTRADLLPTHLLEVALKGADPKWLAEADKDEGRAKRTREYMDVLIASFPREVQAPGTDEWEPVSLTPADFATMDQADIDALEDLVFRLRTPEQVEANIAPEDPAPFRDERQHAAAGEDGEDVGDEAELAVGGA
jgi:hypothetical protein